MSISHGDIFPSREPTACLSKFVFSKNGSLTGRITSSLLYGILAESSGNCPASVNYNGNMLQRHQLESYISGPRTETFSTKWYKVKNNTLAAVIHKRNLQVEWKHLTRWRYICIIHFVSVQQTLSFHYQNCIWTARTRDWMIVLITEK